VALTSRWPKPSTTLVAYHEWFERKVKESQAAVARGETVPDDEVRAWLEGRERHLSGF
jgi:predicted transcriptional regulator